MHLTFRRHISPYTWIICKNNNRSPKKKHTQLWNVWDYISWLFHSCLKIDCPVVFWGVFVFTSAMDFYMMYGPLKNGFHAPSIQWNLTTVQPYPPSSKSKQPDDWEKGDFSPRSKGQYGRKRVVWGKSTRSRYYIKLRCHFLCRIGDNKGCGHSVPAAAASVSADDRRMGEGAPRDALFVTYPPHLPHPPTLPAIAIPHETLAILWLILPRVPKYQRSLPSSVWSV